jgi:predicted secreted protein
VHVFGLELKALWQILLVGLIVGAGLPLLFSLGIRASAWGTGGDAEVQHGGVAAAPHPLGRALAALCFLIVVAVVVLGLVYIVATGFGKELSFSHVYPTIVDKK